MNFNITLGQLERLTNLCPDFLFKNSYIGEVVPIHPFSETEILKEILDYHFPFERIEEAGFFGFKNVGMHIDDIYEKGFKSLAIFIDGCGSLQYFENKEDYKKIKISDLSVRPGSLVIFDQMLPHSFSLGFEETSCVALLAVIK
jgi:hypothetical protein